MLCQIPCSYVHIRECVASVANRLCGLSRKAPSSDYGFLDTKQVLVAMACRLQNLLQQLWPFIFTADFSDCVESSAAKLVTKGNEAVASNRSPCAEEEQENKRRSHLEAQLSGVSVEGKEQLELYIRCCLFRDSVSNCDS